MRRLIVSVLTVLFALSAASCGRTDPNAAAGEISRYLAESEKIVVTSSVTADYGDRVFDFKLTCTKSPEKTELEIKAPESLAGMKAVCTDGGYALSFDGVQVTTGALTRDGLSPAEALPALLEQWQTGYVSGAVSETYNGTDTVALDTHITDTVTQRTWFDTSTLLPLHSEISQDGKAVIFCDFENIIIE